MHLYTTGNLLHCDSCILETNIAHSYQVFTVSAVCCLEDEKYVLCNKDVGI